MPESQCSRQSEGDRVDSVLSVHHDWRDAHPIFRDAEFGRTIGSKRSPAKASLGGASDLRQRLVRVHRLPASVRHNCPSNETAFFKRHRFARLRVQIIIPAWQGLRPHRIAVARSLVSKRRQSISGFPREPSARLAATPIKSVVLEKPSACPKTEASRCRFRRTRPTLPVLG